MNNAQDHIKRLQEKLQLLLKQHSSLQKENEKLEQQALLLAEKNISYQQQVSELTQQVALLKASKTGLSEEEKKDFEKRIDQYIREIDKCISALSE